MVGSVSEFVERIVSTRAPVGRVTAYRGHASSTFSLQPSVFRDPLAKKNEHILLRELIASHPSEFVSDQETLEQLVRLQHYSLPTRLLDVSWNPLVALYFACQPNKRRIIDASTRARKTVEDDGEVIITRVGRSRLRYFDSDTVCCLANLARLKTSLKDELDTSMPATEFNKSLPVRRLIHFIRQEKMQFEPEIIPKDLNRIILVKPKQSNKRILAQDGAFFIFGQTHEILDDNKQGIEIDRISVPASNKIRILKQLDRLAINQKTLFPEIDSAALYIRQNMRSNEFLAKVLMVIS
ncbi:MAG: hypothetical protein JWR84_3278 [Caulobacter sp.]|nr:hypothetical protein [Caulobacter sp.]